MTDLGLTTDLTDYTDLADDIGLHRWYLFQFPKIRETTETIRVIRSISFNPLLLRLDYGLAWLLSSRIISCAAFSGALSVPSRLSTS